MISRLASPSVCVIDDEENEYRAILDALLHLGLGCLHIRGDNSEYLPSSPFKGLRIVFTDLHLSTPTGKGAASHTANIFIRVVSPETAPVIVVIWSKYSSDKVVEDESPPDDQPTEAECFKKTLLDAQPRFKDRLIFLEMEKPKLSDRPEEKKWVNNLKAQIQDTLKDLPAFDILFSWEALVRNSGIAVSDGLTTIAASLSDKSGTLESEKSIHNNLQKILQRLVNAQGDPNCSNINAPYRLASVLAQCLTDQLEHSPDLNKLKQHGSWLSDFNSSTFPTNIDPQINGLLLTEAYLTKSAPFLPGTIYHLTDLNKFKKLFCEEAENFIERCCNKSKGNPKHSEWKEKAKIIFIEISPTCDVAQGNRHSALLLAGLILPSDINKNAKNSGAFYTLPSFSLRWPTDDFNEKNVFLLFCSWYKLTLQSVKEPKWIRPWFRLRELPAAALRNWYSSHSSRVGFVSLG